MGFVSIISCDKIQLRFGRKWNKFRNFFITLFAQKIQSETNFDVIFSLNCSLSKPREINETMNPIFGLGHEI